MVSNASVIFYVLTLTVCVNSYTAVWFKVRKVSKSAGSWTTRQKKCVQKARVMAVFVVAYFAQWLPGFIVNIWALFARLHVSIGLITVIFVNIGGFFNFVAYTVIRKKYTG